MLTQLLHISKSSPLQRNSAAGFLLLGLFTADAAAIVDSIASHETVPIIFVRKYRRLTKEHIVPLNDIWLRYPR